jgi:DNA adenine methylase
VTLLAKRDAPKGHPREGQFHFPFDAKPFLKWAGGKRQLVPAIRELMPRTYNRYVEPFVGGGALFFAVAPDGTKHERVILGDVNRELMTTYLGVRDDLDAVIASLAEHKRLHDKAHYLETRARGFDELYGEGSMAARMIYLNKTCFNGLYRVSQKKGTFNVPMGRYKDPTILDEPGLRACSAVLHHADAQIHKGDYKLVCRHAEKGDFVYFDPPYAPTSATANFVGYAQGGFGEDEQRALAQLFSDLTDEGVYCILSNADTPFVRELYADFPIREVKRSGAMNSKASKRQAVPELLIRGWAWGQS